MRLPLTALFLLTILLPGTILALFAQAEFGRQLQSRATALCFELTHAQRQRLEAQGEKLQ